VVNRQLKLMPKRPAGMGRLRLFAVRFVLTALESILFPGSTSTITVRPDGYTVTRR